MHAVYTWQKPVWQNLTSRFPNIGHGLLFYGKNGCGKHEFAQQFIAWVLCLNKQQDAACGHCTSCLWLKSDTHPNYVHVTTDPEQKKQNSKIKIEKIRDLQPFLQQTVDGWRVVFIEPAEALNTASANALLKTLEEPGERIIIILLADHYLKLPATIRSRLQHYALDRVSYLDSKQYIQSEKPDVTAEQVDLMLNLANDMPLGALSLLDAQWIFKREQFLQDWLLLVSQKNQPLQLATKWNKELPFSDFSAMLEFLLTDVVCTKLQQPIKNIDLNFDELAQYYALEQLFALYDQMQHAKKMIDQNVQSNLVIDKVFMQLMNVQV